MRILIVIDADGSNDPREIPRFIRALLEGSDFVKGSRFAPRGGTTDMPRYRRLVNICGPGEMPGPVFSSAFIRPGQAQTLYPPRRHRPFLHTQVILRSTTRRLR